MMHAKCITQIVKLNFRLLGLFNYEDVYILVKGTITVENTDTDADANNTCK